MSSNSPLRFKNFKGGDYRAKADGGTYRIRRLADDSWSVDVRVDGQDSWSGIGTGADRGDAERRAQEYAEANGPAELAKQARARSAIAAVAAACARRKGLAAQLHQANEQLAVAIREAFDADVKPTPLLEITTPVGIKTRNRLYQIRDGKR